MNVKTCSALAFALMTTGLPITSWAAGCGGVTNGLIACYPFDGDANDASGNGLNGIVNGATLTTDRFGNQNSAYLFNGVDNYIVVKNSAILNPKQITLSAWFFATKSFDGDGNNVIISKPYTSHVAPYYQWHLGVGGDQHVSARQFGFLGWMATSAGALSTDKKFILGTEVIGVWKHLVTSFDGSVVKVYVDGKLEMTSRSLSTPSVINTYNTDVFIGKHGNAMGTIDYTPAIIDDIRIYNRALTADEIKQLYDLPNTSNQNCDDKHAKFDPTTGLLTVPAVDAPTLDPITGESTGTLATFSGQFNLLRGVEDFGLVSDSFKVVSVDVATHDSCHGEYIYADGKFSKGGTLHLPFVDVSSVVIIPPNLQMPGPVKTYDVTMKQLALDAMIFHISDYKLLQK